MTALSHIDMKRMDMDDMRAILTHVLKVSDTFNTRLDNLERKYEQFESESMLKKRAIRSGSALSTPRFDGKQIIEVDANVVGFPGDDASEDDSDSDLEVGYPLGKRFWVKDPPPKFSGHSDEFIEWSEDFVRYAINWGFNPALFSEVDLDV